MNVMCVVSQPEQQMISVSGCNRERINHESLESRMGLESRVRVVCARDDPTYAPNNGSDDDTVMSNDAGSSGNSRSSQGRIRPDQSQKRKSTAILELEEARALHKKKAKKGQRSETERMIYDKFRSMGWKKVKFANSLKQKKAATKIILDLLELEDFIGDDEETKKQREDWIELNMPLVLKKLNSCRSYGQTEAIKAVKAWMETHEGEIPSLEDLERCLKREIDPTNEDDYELFEWYSTKLVKAACCNADDWNVDSFYYLCLWNAAPPKSPEDLYVPPSTEAIAVGFVENNRSKLMEFWKLQGMPQHRGITKIIPKVKIDYAEDGKTPTWDYKINPNKKSELLVNGPKYLGKYSIQDGGQMDESGWTREGREAFVKWTNMNKEARKDPAKRDIEGKFLTELRAANGITAGDHAAQKALKTKKKGKKASMEEDEGDEVEMDYE